MAYTVVYRPKRAPQERLLLVGGFGEDTYAAMRKTPWLVEEVLDGDEALREAARREYGVVLCSLRMKGAWGLDVLDAILKADPLTPVIMSTHERNPKVIVEAMQRGAYEYLIEPFEDMDYVLAVLRRAVSRRAALRRGQALREELSRGEADYLRPLVGRSAAMRELCERIRQVAAAHSPVLIEGESGSGKELVARAIHQGSARKHGPFVEVHCGAIPETLLESELFGHEKGAFTGAESTRIGVFEAAHGGSLFLDEIGLTSPACQAKLLRALEAGAIRRVGATRELGVDVRVVSATNEPLESLVKNGRFRQDLFFRLNVVALRVPPLRERKEDVPLLAHYFAMRFAQEAGKPFEAFSEGALRALEAYDFPGNVRELRNVIERAVVFARGPVIGWTELPEHLRTIAAQAAPPAPPEEPHPATGFAAASREAYMTLTSPDAPGLDRRLESIERAFIEQALLLARDNRTRAAELLKINRTTLLQKMVRLGLGGAPVPKSGKRAAQPKAKRPGKSAARESKVKKESARRERRSRKR